MKLRTGFVSNSSSSSFVCSVCGQSESGWDASIHDFEMFECEQGHLVCIDHVTEGMNEQEKKEFEDILEENDSYDMPSKYCPICQIKAIRRGDMIKYLLKVLGKTEDDVISEVAALFENDFEKFQKHLKTKSS